MSTQADTGTATQGSGDTLIPFRLEVIVIPVADSEGNRYVLQEITERFPGRV